MSGGGGSSGSGDRRTDSGWISSTTIAQAAGIAIATLQTVAQIQIASKQESIARGYLQMAQQLRDYWMTAYVPCEAATVAEACAEPKYVPQYDLQAGRFAVSIRQQFANVQDKLGCIGRYCVGLTAAMAKDMAIAEALAVGDGINFGYRYEDARKEAKDDVRWNRRYQALAMGRNLPAQSLAYAKAAEGAYGNLAGQMKGSLGSLLGYALGRDETPVPQNQGYGEIAPPSYGDVTATNTTSAPLPPPRPTDLGDTKVMGQNFTWEGSQMAGNYSSDSDMMDMYRIGGQPTSVGTTG